MFALGDVNVISLTVIFVLLVRVRDRPNDCVSKSTLSACKCFCCCTAAGGCAGCCFTLGAAAVGSDCVKLLGVDCCCSAMF